jgi:hypothetical protein
MSKKIVIIGASGHEKVVAVGNGGITGRRVA